MELKRRLSYKSQEHHPVLTTDSDETGDVAIVAVFPSGRRVKLAFVGSVTGKLRTCSLEADDREALEPYLAFAPNGEWVVD